MFSQYKETFRVGPKRIKEGGAAVREQFIMQEKCSSRVLQKTTKLALLLRLGKLPTLPTFNLTP